MGYPSISSSEARAAAPGSDLDFDTEHVARTTVSTGTHTIDIIDTMAHGFSDSVVEALAADGDSSDVVARSESLIRTNRRGSGWNTLEIPLLEIAPWMASTLETPAVRSARLSPIGTPDTHVLTRRSRYEAATTIAVSKQSMDDYVRELNANSERGGFTTSRLPASGTALDGVELWADAAPLPSMQQSRALPLVGISVILILLLSAGWLVAREWPTDFTPSVKALVSDR